MQPGRDRRSRAQRLGRSIPPRFTAGSSDANGVLEPGEQVRGGADLAQRHGLAPGAHRYRLRPRSVLPAPPTPCSIRRPPTRAWRPAPTAPVPPIPSASGSATRRPACGPLGRDLHRDPEHRGRQDLDAAHRRLLRRRAAQPLGVPLHRDHLPQPRHLRVQRRPVQLLPRRDPVPGRDGGAAADGRARPGLGAAGPRPGPVFTDVPIDHWAGDFIEQLAAEGITSGCGGGQYCPTAPITRAEMAVFC